MPREPGVSQIALVAAPHLVFTGTQVSFGYEEKDARLAFERLKRALEQAGVRCATWHTRTTIRSRRESPAQVRKVRSEFFDSARPPAGAVLTFEGLPSMDAGFAVDVVVAKD